MVKFTFISETSQVRLTAYFSNYMCGSIKIHQKYVNVTQNQHWDCLITGQGNTIVKG